jgi:hypothetical protein
VPLRAFSARRPPAVRALLRRWSWADPDYFRYRARPGAEARSSFRPGAHHGPPSPLDRGRGPDSACGAREPFSIFISGLFIPRIHTNFQNSCKIV